MENRIEEVKRIFCFVREELRELGFYIESMFVVVNENCDDDNAVVKFCVRD